VVEINKPASPFISLLEGMLAQSDVEGGVAPNSGGLPARAALSLALLRSESAGASSMSNEERMALVAAVFDGELNADQRARLEVLRHRSSGEIQDIASSLELLDRTTKNLATAPTHLVEAAVAALKAKALTAERGGDVIPFGHRPSLAPHPVAADYDRFELLAAASNIGKQAVVCRSQSGLWTLEIFVGSSERDLALKQGYLLLTVHSDHRATYDGRSARVFVITNEGERVLAEDVVRAGEIYVPISLAGLDLHTRDAVNVVFAAQYPSIKI